MKIVEAKDGVIKFETEQKLDLSSFIEINDSNKEYIAQIIQIKYNGAGYTGYARLLFNYDGAMQKYDKTLPELSAEIKIFPYEIVSKVFENANGIYAGKFGTSDNLIKISSLIFDKKTLVSSDNGQNLTVLLQNFAKQNEKSLIIDMNGTISGERYFAGADFKIPVNRKSLAFIYDECLSDATGDSKELIKSIFAELAEYSDTVPFLPFSVLKSTVDDMVDKSHEFKLIVLKNKLALFKQKGCFASDKKEFESLQKILNSKYSIIDLSNLDPNFKNKYIEVIYSELEKSENPPQVYLNMSDSINKKTINTTYKSPLSTLFVSSSRFKYLGAINSLFKNFIIEGNNRTIQAFPLYKPFLSSLSADNYLFVGELTNYIPLVLKPEIIETCSSNQETIIEDVAKEDVIEPEILLDDNEQNLQNNLLNEDSYADKNLNASIEEVESDVNVEKIENETNIDSDMENQHTISSEKEFEEGFHTQVNEITHTESVSEEISDIQTPETIPVEKYAENADDTDDYSTENDNTDNIEEVVQLDNEDDILEEENEPAEKIETSNENNYTIDENTLNNFQESRDINVDDLKILPLNQNEEIDTSPITELSISESDSDDVLVEMDEEILDVITDTSTDNNNTLDQEIIDDVDKVYTTVKDESISDIDLDLIDELNEIDSANDNSALIIEDESSEDSELSDFEELDIKDDEDEFLEPLTEVSDSLNENSEENSKILETRNTSTPMVPVYDAEIPDEDKVESDHIEQGDTVSHAKYGTGIVEKMIKYGSKNLYSINFDNVGRRLLDPNLTEIKKA